MPGPHYFAWCDEGTVFSPAVQVEDEPIFELEISHAEGDFPSLAIEIANPRMGLLGPGRQQWCWVSWDDGSEVVPLFHGRLVGVPENLTDEVVRLLFVARPSDYPEQKAALSETLKEPPYWDPIWVQEGIEDPDTAWEARAELPHIDRVSLAVTSSSIVAGEDGTIDVLADEHFYDGVSVSYTGQPLRRIKVTGTVRWDQVGAGEVDLTRDLVLAFQAAGSPYQSPMVSSYTAEGLLGEWPQPLADLGGGWSMAPNSSAAAAVFVASSPYAVRFTDKSDMTSVVGFIDEPAIGGSNLNPTRVFFINWKNVDVVFEIAPIHAEFRVSYAAERKRSEVVTFTLSSDIQSILADPGAAEEDTLDLSSAFVDQPVDPDEGLPIGDPRRNAYFPTERGLQSLEFLMTLARAKLLSSARAVEVTFESTWQKLAAALSCRQSVTLHDPRLPGGQAIGKIISYRFAANGEGEMIAGATIGCSIGFGVALADAAVGEDTYADDYADDYTETTGGEIAVIPGVLHYESLDGTYVFDDDGVDLFDLTPRTVVNSLMVTDGPNAQRLAIDASLSAIPADVRLQTTGDIVTDGGSSSIENMASVDGLVAGTVYHITGGGIPNPFVLTSTGFAEAATKFTFDGSDGGSLSRVSTAGDNVTLLISAFRGAVLTPDPVGALGAHPTVVALDLVPVTGGDFRTEYAVNVLPLVIPQGINLEAA